jgi:hypothetical protein
MTPELTVDQRKVRSDQRHGTSKGGFRVPSDIVINLNGTYSNEVVLGHAWRYTADSNERDRHLSTMGTSTKCNPGLPSLFPTLPFRAVAHTAHERGVCDRQATR